MARPQPRQKARGHALEFLFGLEFTADEWQGAMKAFWEVFEARATVRAYTETLVAGVQAHKVELDAAIDGALTNWRPERVGRIERNVLRIALFEMLHTEDVPPKVAINEAINLARAYGNDESPGFVNAVLDRLNGARTSENTA